MSPMFVCNLNPPRISNHPARWWLAQWIQYTKHNAKHTQEYKSNFIITQSFYSKMLTLNSQKTSHSSPIRVSFRVSFMNSKFGLYPALHIFTLCVIYGMLLGGVYIFVTILIWVVQYRCNFKQFHDNPGATDGQMTQRSLDHQTLQRWLRITTYDVALIQGLRYENIGAYWHSSIQTVGNLMGLFSLVLSPLSWPEMFYSWEYTSQQKINTTRSCMTSIICT